MPEYLAPGVYIEEVSFRAKTIEGVSTSTAAFVGPTRFGPVEGDPELLTSFTDFERIYGSLDQLVWYDAGGNPRTYHNFTAHAVRSFFEEGGKRLYVSRVFRSLDADGVNAGEKVNADGYSSHAISSGLPGDANKVTLFARYPGSGGDVQVTFSIKLGQNVLAGEPLDPNDPSGPTEAVLRGVSSYDTVWIADLSSPISSPPGAGTLYYAVRKFDNATNRIVWNFYRSPVSSPDAEPDLTLKQLTPDVDEVRVVTVSVQVSSRGRSPRSRGSRSEVWDNLTFDPNHPRSLSRVFDRELASRLAALTVPVVVQAGDDAEQDTLSGPEIAEVLLSQARQQEDRPRILRLLGLPTNDTMTDLSILATLGRSELGDADRQITFQLEGGNDGLRPKASDFEGKGDDDPKRTSGLKALENIADVSIVAAPGSSFDYLDEAYKPDGKQIARLLISHAERMRYRIAVLDAPDRMAISEIRSYRGQVDSEYAALYYPWIRILDPVTEQEINIPPSGTVAGIYARNDVENGVHKAPANEVVRQALGLELMLNKAQQDVLNPEGINCFRFFEGRGYRLWGARTISSDPEWKYVNLRRYFAFLERSIELGTQWVVFGNNSEALWANVRRTVEDFLFNEWKSGHLLGEKPTEAYFVRCDRSTMTQNDLDNGRLICLIGVAPVRPAEFVIFRIGQWTADRAN